MNQNKGSTKESLEVMSDTVLLLSEEEIVLWCFKLWLKGPVLSPRENVKASRPLVPAQQREEKRDNIQYE